MHENNIVQDIVLNPNKIAATMTQILLDISVCSLRQLHAHSILHHGARPYLSVLLLGDRRANRDKV